MYLLPGEPDCLPDPALADWTPQAGEQFWFLVGGITWTLCTGTGQHIVTPHVFYRVQHKDGEFYIGESSLQHVLRVGPNSEHRYPPHIAALDLDAEIWPERARSFTELLDSEDYVTYEKRRERCSPCPRCGMTACMHPKVGG